MMQVSALAELPRVTIAIPTHNRRGLLERAIDSASNQSYPNINILVSDNASSDTTPELCSACSAELSGFSFYRHELLVTPVENFCSLIARSTGDYIYILADDDWLHPTAIEKLVRFTKSNRFVVAVSSYAQECTLLGAATIMHTHPGLCSTSPLIQLLHLLNPFCQHFYACGVYGLLSRSTAVKLFPRKPLVSFTGRELFTGDEIIFLVQIVCSGGLGIYPEPLLYYTGPIGRDVNTVSQAVLVSQNLSSLDLLSFYFLSCLRVMSIVLRAAQFRLPARLFLCTYSFVTYALFIFARILVAFASASASVFNQFVCRRRRGC